MKVLSLLSLPFLLLSTPSGCSRNQESGTVLTQALPVIAVTMPGTLQAGDSLIAEVTCGTPNPCWEFQRAEITRTDSVYSVAIIARYDGRPCIQVLGTLTARIAVLPPGPGSYHFTFTQAEGSTLRKSLAVQ